MAMDSRTNAILRTWIDGACGGGAPGSAGRSINSEPSGGCALFTQRSVRQSAQAQNLDVPRCTVAICENFWNWASRSLPSDDATPPQQQGEQERRQHGSDDRSEAAEAIRIEPDHVLCCERPTIDDLALDRMRIRGRAQKVHAHDPGAGATQFVALVRD